jgi:multidrug efflux pump
MIISDTAVRRPVFATVISLLLIAFGLIAFDRLPLREYPDIDPPIVGIETIYRGAAAAVVETRITEVIEERIAGVEGIEFIQSSSQDGRSTITVQFTTGRDVDAAANDIRDRVSSILSSLPVEADPPEIRKVDSNESVIMWINLVSDRMTVPELTDYAQRYLVDRFSVLDGVARVFVGGQQRYAMRIWLDRKELAARQLTVNDVENALRANNVELPAGEVESVRRRFTVRVDRQFESADDFRRLVIGEGATGIWCGSATSPGSSAAPKTTARSSAAIRSRRSASASSGSPRPICSTWPGSPSGKSICSAPTLPEGMEFMQSYDSSIFVEGAVNEVYKTLMIAVGLVVLTIFLFLGSVRAMLVPAVTVPVCIIATFIALLTLGFSVNLLTLLALVLAIGLVVDDAIVMLENIHRRIDRYGETPLVAAYRGARQVGLRNRRDHGRADCRVRAHRLSAGRHRPPVLRVRSHHGVGRVLLEHRRPDARARTVLEGASCTGRREPPHPPGRPQLRGRQPRVPHLSGVRAAPQRDRRGRIRRDRRHQRGDAAAAASGVHPRRRPGQLLHLRPRPRGRDLRVHAALHG